MNKYINDQRIFDEIFKKYSENISVILTNSKIKGENFDKFRDTGYEKTYQNPIYILALTKAVSANSLIIREIGLTETGAFQIIIQDQDVNLIKLAHEILIDNIKYTPWNKALGGRFQISPIGSNYKKIILFRINDQ